MLHDFLIIYQPTAVFNVFISIFLLFHKLFHLNYGYSGCCERVFICWTAEVFTAFIDKNITITCLSFIFRRAQILFFSLRIICTQKTFSIIRSLSRFVVALQFLILYFFVEVSDCFVGVSDCFVKFSDCFVDVSDYFVDTRFYKAGLNAPLAFHYLSNMFD